jgi:hypothetical protein
MIHGKLYKTRFSEIGFTMNSPSDWLETAQGSAPVLSWLPSHRNESLPSMPRQRESGHCFYS